MLWKIPIKSDPVADARVVLKHLGLITKLKKCDRRPSDIEIFQLVEYCKNKVRQVLRMADIIQFAIASAMRAGEIGSLRWSDLNQKDKTILIRERKDPQDKKWQRPDHSIAENSRLGCFSDSKRQPKTDGLIFPWNFDTVSSIFPRACRALGIIDLHFHDLRREGVSRLFEAGYQLQEVAIVQVIRIGHS